ncbi:MAG: hypothetical protein WC947_09080 [Elusimicrobiota bacterium]
MKLKIKTILFLIIIFVPVILYGADIINENFEGGGTPAGWTNNGPVTWSITHANSPTHSESFAKVAWYLITPVLNYPAALTYWMYASAGASSFNIQYSTNAATWASLPGSPTATDYGGTFMQETFDLSSYNNIYIKFYRSGSKTYYLDDVVVTQRTAPDIVAVQAGPSLDDRTSFTSGAPFGYMAAGSDGQISFTWTNPTYSSVFYYEYNNTATGTIDGSESGTTDDYIDDFPVDVTNHYFHVRPRDGDGNGQWGTERVFIVEYILAPDKPSSLVQIGESGNQLASMQWTNSSTIISSFTQASDQLKFHLQVSSFSSFSPLFFETTSQLLSQGTTGYKWPALTDNGTYWWRVWSENSNGLTSSTSTELGSGGNAKLGFDCIPPAGISDLTALAGPVDGSITLKWTAPGDDGTAGSIAGGAYWVKYSTNPLGNETTFGTAATFTVQSTNTVTQQALSTNVTGLNPGTSYYFAVKFRDKITNNWASWSTGTFVNTLSSAAAQDLSPPAPAGLTATASNTQITLTWNAVSVFDLDHYQIYCDSQT